LKKKQNYQWKTKPKTNFEIKNAKDSNQFQSKFNIKKNKNLMVGNLLSFFKKYTGSKTEQFVSANTYNYKLTMYNNMPC